MLAALPFWIRFAILFCSGAILGALINWAIYAWALILHRPISPWMKPSAGESPRIGLDRIPIVGWIGRRRDGKTYGSAFWIRPLLIEISWAIGLPWFYQWQLNGGLTGGAVPPVGLAETWFVAHSILLALMCIGTFIDFDEKTIPDQVTVTGTIIALLMAALVPSFRLPIVSSSIAGHSIEPLLFTSPHDLPSFHLGSSGLLIGLFIFAFWIWALLPKLPVWRFGLRTTFRFMLAYALQSKRKTKCAIRTQTRSTPGLTILLGILLVVGLIGIVLAWQFLPPAGRDSLFGSLLGLAFGGSMIWSIRIVGTYAMQQEAMGFGDVTLMAMIGAFVGWQVPLLALGVACFVALAVVLIQFALTRDNAMAFGPYLCIGTVTVLYFWYPTWQHASRGVFILGPMLLYILIGSLVALGLMLFALQWFKSLFRDEELEA